MQRLLRKNYRGFTVVELIVAITVLSLLTPVVIFTLGNYYEDNLSTITASTQDADVRQALATITSDLQDTRGFRASFTVSNSTAPLGSTSSATGNGNWSYCGTNTTSITCDGVTTDNGATDRVLIAYNNLTDGPYTSSTTGLIYVNDGQSFNLSSAVPAQFVNIYFVAPDRNNPSQDNLYKRTIVQVDPNTADTYKSASSGLRGTPFQKTSCASTVVSANSSVCLASDAVLLYGVSSFWVDYYDSSNQKIPDYYTSNAGTAATVASNIKTNAASVEVTITKKMTNFSKKTSTASGLINVNSNSASSTAATVSEGLLLHLDAGNTTSYSGSGSTWTDISGLSNNGTISGATYSAAGGGSLVYSTNAITTVPMANLRPTGAITQECWVYITSNVAQVFIGAQYGNAGNNSYALWFNGANTLLGGVMAVAGTFNAQSYSFTVTTNKWYHFVHTYDGINQKVYINGTLVNSWATSGSIVYDTNNTRLAVGNDWNSGYDGGAGVGVNGNLAVVRIYKRALSSSEILQNYNFSKGKFGL